MAVRYEGGPAALAAAAAAAVIVVMVARLPKFPPETVPGTRPMEDSFEDESANPTAAATDKF